MSEPHTINEIEKRIERLENKLERRQELVENSAEEIDRGDGIFSKSNRRVLLGVYDKTRQAEHNQYQSINSRLRNAILDLILLDHVLPADKVHAEISDKELDRAKDALEKIQELD